MHHQVFVRVRDRLACRDEQAHTLSHRQAEPVAVAVDALTVHVLQHQVALARFGDARVEQARDVRVVQPAQQLAFAGEACLRAGIADGQPHQLDGGQAVVQAIGAPRQPDLAHAAAADQAVDLPGAQPTAGQRRVANRIARHGLRTEERCGLCLSVGGNQLRDARMQRGFTLGQGVEPCGLI